LIQDANKVVKSAADWDSLQNNLGIVLEGLAKSTATVAAVHASGSNEPAAAAAAAAAAGGGSSEVYLSSYKLFGLQLADSAFRRGFLVQVRVLRMLRWKKSQHKTAKLIYKGQRACRQM
jgi:NAD/NADP transhydrogenase alpha subunit